MTCTRKRYDTQHNKGSHKDIHNFGGEPAAREPHQSLTMATTRFLWPLLLLLRLLPMYQTCLYIGHIAYSIMAHHNHKTHTCRSDGTFYVTRRAFEIGAQCQTFHGTKCMICSQPTRGSAGLEMLTYIRVVHLCSNNEGSWIG